MHLPCEAVNEIVQRHFSKICHKLDQYMLHGKPFSDIPIVSSDVKVCRTTLKSEKLNFLFIGYKTKTKFI